LVAENVLLFFHLVLVFLKVIVNGIEILARFYTCQSSIQYILARHKQLQTF
jgi:hypothetical protein